jgi:uncharacterized protein
VNWLRDQGCVEIYGLGESLGASVLIQAAALQPAFRAIVAECPYADLRSIAEYRVEQLSHVPAGLSRLLVGGGVMYAKVRYGLDFNRVALISAMAQTKTPILLIHGMRDSRAPPWHSERLARQNTRAALWLVPDAGHVAASSKDPQEFRKRVLEWFAR